MLTSRTGGAARLFRGFDLVMADIKRLLHAVDRSAATASSLVSRISERPDLDEAERVQLEKHIAVIDKVRAMIDATND